MSHDCRDVTVGNEALGWPLIRENAFGWVMLGLAAVAALVMIAAAVTQFVAWVGAVINTAGLQDKTWFIILLVTGLLSFGFIAMIIYLIAGPDDPPRPSVEPALRQAASRDLRSRSA